MTRIVTLPALSFGLAGRSVGYPPHMSSASTTVTVALVNDYEIIVQGLAAMLAPFSPRVQVVEITVGSEPSGRADVALFDTFAGRRHAIDRALERVAKGERIGLGNLHRRRSMRPAITSHLPQRVSEGE